MHLVYELKRSMPQVLKVFNLSFNLLFFLYFLFLMIWAAAKAVVQCAWGLGGDWVGTSYTEDVANLTFSYMAAAEPLPKLPSKVE